VDVAPHAIVLGHGHFDHAENAAYVAAKTGAPLYASEETCGVMRADFERMRKDPAIQDDPVARFPTDAVLNLVPVTTTDSTPGTPPSVPLGRARDRPGPTARRLTGSALPTS